MCVAILRRFSCAGSVLLAKVRDLFCVTIGSVLQRFLNAGINRTVEPLYMGMLLVAKCSCWSVADPF